MRVDHYYPEKCFIPKVDEKLVSSKDQSVFSRDNTNGTTESSSEETTRNLIKFGIIIKRLFYNM